MSSQANAFVTEAEYLEIERQAETRSEYHNGQMFAMSGGSAEHAQIIANVVIALGNRLRDRPCRVFSNDLRLNVSPSGLYTYPDVMVVCGPLQFVGNRRDTVLNPSVLIEVLSPSTKRYDIGEKFEFYSDIKTLTSYLTVAQDAPHIHHWKRQGDNQWLLTDYRNLTDSILLESIECTLPLTEVYDKVDWAAEA